jgi:hypothetical protein
MKLRPGSIPLFLGACLYGLWRGFLFHPAFQNGYRAWLESAPWTCRKPLPFGPIELVWEDGLVLGALVLLSATQPHPPALYLLCTFLYTYLLVLELSFWLTRSWAAGYATAFGLGLVVWLLRHPIACLASLIVVYAITYAGLRQTMARFPRALRKLPKPGDDLSSPAMSWGIAPLGWPHDPMMAGIVEDHGIWRIDAVLVCMLSVWWLSGIASLFPEAQERFVIAVVAICVAMVLAPIARLGKYTQGCSSPISLRGRIRTGRWIIPGHDRVFIAPICALIAGPATVVLLRACTIDASVSYTIGAGMVVLVATLTPPRLRNWRLTGEYRMTFQPPTSIKDTVVKVG